MLKPFRNNALPPPPTPPPSFAAFFFFLRKERIFHTPSFPNFKKNITLHCVCLSVEGKSENTPS